MTGETFQCLYAVGKPDGRIEDGELQSPDDDARGVLLALDRRGDIVFALIRPCQEGQPFTRGAWRAWVYDETGDWTARGFCLSEWPEPVTLIREPAPGSPLLHILPLPLAVCVSEAVKFLAEASEAAKLVGKDYA